MFNKARNSSDDDCFEGLSEFDLKQEHKYEEFHEEMASKLKFICTLQYIQEICKEKGIPPPSAPSADDEVIIVRKAVNKLMEKENSKTVKDFKKINSCKYYDVVLIADDIEWIQPEDFKEGDEQPYQWHYLALSFYFPVKNKIIKISMKNCISCFVKPQRINIMSWLRKRLRDDGYDLKQMGVPRCLKGASELIGAAIGDLSHADVAKSYLNP
jgi:hypothetical protein